MPEKKGKPKAKAKGKPKPKAKAKGSSVLTEPKGKPKAKAKAKGKPKAKPASTPPPEPKTIEVSLVQFGTGETPIQLVDGETVSDLLVKAGLSSKNGSVLINSQPAQLDDKVPAGATVVFATKIKGGRQ